MDDEPPNLITGRPFGPGADEDIRWELDHGETVDEIAEFLCRMPSEIRERIREIEAADALGAPDMLSDRMTPKERAAIETYRDAPAAWR